MKPIGEETVHYKSYKAGKRWLYASITVLTLGLGTLATTETVRADTPDSVPVTGVQATAADPTTSDDPGVATTTTATATAEPTDVTPASPVVDAGGTPDETVVSPANEDTQLPDETTPDKVPSDDQPTVDLANEPVTPETPTVEPTTGSDDVTDGAPADLAPPADVADSGDQTGDIAATISATRAAANLPSIENVPASVWLPDETLRKIIITDLRKTTGKDEKELNEDTLYKFAGNDFYKFQLVLQGFPNISGYITSLQGLEYFTNMTSFRMDTTLMDPAAMIDLSFAPNLTGFDYGNNDPALKSDWGMSGEEFVQTYLSQNTKLTFFRLNKQNLTGEIPHFTNQPALKTVYLVGNQFDAEIPNLDHLVNLTTLDIRDNALIGGIDNLMRLPALTGLHAENNQFSGPIATFNDSLVRAYLNGNHFSGPLPDLKNITTLHVYDNDFSGDLPNAQKLSQFYYERNHFTTGLQIGAPGFNGLGQTVYTPTIVIDADHLTFAPAEGLVNGLQNPITGVTTAVPLTMAQFLDGNVISTIIMVEDADGNAIKPANAEAFFTVTQDEDGNYLLTADPEVASGMYTIFLKPQDGSSFSSKIYIKLDNHLLDTEEPGDPDPGDPDPGDPDPGNPDPGNPDPGNPDPGNPDPGNPVDPEEPTDPETPVDPEEPAQPTNPDNSTDLDKTTTGTQPDRVDPAKSSTTKRAVATTLTTKSPTIQTTGSPTTPATQPTDTATTLPQTNEQSTTNPIVAGLLLLLATLGFADFRKKRH